MFPQTFFTKKAFLPVIDTDGTVKPVLMYLLEELADAGIEDIYLVIGEGEEEAYRKIFNGDENETYRDFLSDNARAYYDRMTEIGQKIHFTVQKKKNGFGHAVYQARKFLNKEPAIMMLGDFIYKSNLDISCTQQTINAYNKSGGKAVVSIKRIPFEDSKNYGIVHGSFTTERPYLMEVDKMIEKPSKEQAEQELSVNGECFATFGQYVLTDEVFQYLEQEIEKKKNGEVNITNALMNMAEKGELIGVDVAGESFDVGIPEMYYKTFINYRK